MECAQIIPHLSQANSRKSALNAATMCAAKERSNIVQLAQSIAANTAIVDAYVREHNLPAFDFDDIGAPALPRTVNDTNAESARRAVVTATQELGDLLSGPMSSLKVDWTAHSCLRTILRFKLAEAVSLNPINDIGTSFESVAAQSSLPKSDVVRILRHAMTRHVFREPTPGFVAHTAASALLAQDPATRDVLGLTVDEFWPAGYRVPDALAKWPGAHEPEQTAFALANENEVKNQGKSMWSIYEEDAERARRFGVYMSVIDKDIPFPLETLEWEGLVVDVGGGVGYNAFNLAKNHPNTRFVVEDLPKMIQQGKLLIPEEVKARISFVEHDFFTQQPVKHADIYFFRRIFHDWSDEHADKILQNLVPALKPGARIRVNEMLMPHQGERPREIERIMRNVDFTMLALCNGKERNLEEWQALFRRTSEYFKFHFCKTTPMGMLAVIEFVWKP